MNRLIEWWARNSVAANLLMVGIFVAGFIGFTSLEREMDPQVRFPGLEIEVVWPGAAPQEVEEQIVARIEEAVSDLDSIEWVRSTSAEGYGGVYILAEQQVDFTQFMNDVKIRVDSISSFPRDIEPPQVRQWVNRNEFIRVAVHGDLDERELKRLAEQLRREAAVLPAITVVELFGVRREEVSVQVSEEALRRYNMSFAEVANAIRNASINQSNFVGTGKKVSLALQTSEANERYEVSYTNPYYTIDGISRGFTLLYRSTDFAELDSADYTTDDIIAGVNFGIPLNEFNRFNFGMAVHQIDFKTGAFPSQEVRKFEETEGDDFLDFEVTLSWRHDSRDSAIFPNTGALQSLSTEATVPGGARA